MITVILSICATLYVCIGVFVIWLANTIPPQSNVVIDVIKKTPFKRLLFTRWHEPMVIIGYVIAVAVWLPYIAYKAVKA